ncbi:6924_t:CDS:2 [Gigaspora margarita]|uniref:6924_t:CDS:1 n=1 Tax=Gigaspora margarita TaxID=4874 RepID=A0ABM8W384_GIGMA|nr:6924_t:CDS:2 [Gigaspora margarita]
MVLKITTLSISTSSISSSTNKNNGFTNEHKLALSSTKKDILWSKLLLLGSNPKLKDFLDLANAIAIDIRLCTDYFISYP